MKLKHPSRILVLSIATSTLLSCATPARRQRTRVHRQEKSHATAAKRPESDVKASPAELAAYNHARHLYAAAKYEAALQHLTAFEKTHPKSPLLGQCQNLRGLVYFLTHRPLQAIASYQSAIQSDPDPNFRQYVLYNLAAAQVDANQLEDAQQSLTEIRPDVLDKDTRIKFHSLRARLFMRRELYLEAARDSLALSRLVDSSQVHGPFEKQLDDALKKLNDVDELQRLYQDYEDSPLADLVLFRLGTQQLVLGRPDAGESQLRQLMDRFPQSSHYAEAAELIHSFEQRTVVRPNAVGVLLPLSGKFAPFGRESLQAIELAFRIFNPDQPDTKLQLVIEDSGDDPDQAIRALNRLFFKDHVIGVIGPLLSKGVDQVSMRAQELGLPLITLSQQPGINGDYIFQSGLTAKLQAEAIAKHAIQTLGLKRFAIVEPRSRFGDQYANAFWDAVNALGGQIVGFESYQPGETDFRHVVDRLSGTYYKEARTREIDALAKYRDENNIKRRTRYTEKYFALPPIVDYQAVFIPDEPKIVGQVLPTFAYRDVEHVKFLGISTWNSPDLVKRAQSYAEGADFVDAFFSDSQSPQIKKFLSQYQSTFDSAPGALEAMAYDAGRIMRLTLMEEAPTSRDQLRDELHSIRNFPGVTGKLTYRDGQFSRELMVLTVRHGQIAEAGR